MDLRSFATALRRHLFLAIVAGALAASTVALATATRTTKFEASAVLRARTPGSITGDVVRTDAPEYLDRLQNTYAELVEGTRLRARVADAIGVTVAPDLFVELTRNSEILAIGARADDATVAANAANAAARELLAELRRQDEETIATAQRAFDAEAAMQTQAITAMQRQLDDATRPNAPAAAVATIPDLRARLDLARSTLGREQANYLEWRDQMLERSNLLALVEEASVPGGRDKTALPFVLVIAALAAALACVGAVSIAENLRTTIADADEAAEAVGAPVIGSITIRGDAHSMATSTIAQFDELALNVLALTAGDAMPTAVITSPVPGGVKAMVTVGLARSLTHMGTRVLVVDADLDDPQVHALVDVPNEYGLADLVDDAGSLADAMVATDIDRLSVVPAGRGASTAHVATFARVGKYLAELGDLDVTALINAPAIRGGHASVALAAELGDVILVATAGVTTFDDLAASARHVEVADAVLSGVVLVRDGRRRRQRSSRRTGADALDGR